MFRAVLFVVSIFVLTFSATYFLAWSLQGDDQVESQAAVPQAAASRGAFSVSQLRFTDAGPLAEYVYTEPQNSFETHSLNHWLIPRRYHAYVKRSAKRDTKKPAIILLHGSGRSGVSVVDMWQSVANRYDLVLIAPDSLSGSVWSTTADPTSLFRAIIADAVDRFGVDPQRVYLFGHSAGGVYATLLALEENSPFRAIATHGGFPSVGMVGHLSNHGRRKPPIRHYLGDMDHIFSVDRARAVGNRMKEAGYSTELVLIPNHTHWYYEIGPQINERIWQFFKRQ
ncbi:MAG: alpha/beta fold hydrolase [Pseudomonadota bacterium]